jgi:ABC-type nitrate/sulfonate/bicarbonate transport system substrate-binding protein/nitrogen-specific signal transduction histidine kinase
MPRALSLFLLTLLSFPATTHATETVRLQLKWQHQFQFAGYYAAKHLGYYREEGLDVQITEAQAGTDVTNIVTHGRAEYGVGNSGLLLSRAAGEPLVVLAVILQHSPFSLITRRDGTIQDVHDLAHKRLMIEPLADDIIAYLNHEGVPLDKFEHVNRVHSLDEFVARNVDAISAYNTSEPYYLDKLGIPFNTFSPRSAGIDFYGDNLFTTEAEINQHPQRVSKFLKASLRGWRYAMTHQDEIIDLILSEYPTPHERGFLVFEAQQMQQLMHPELIDIGYMLPGRWRHIAETYRGLGMLPEDFVLDGFLYSEEPSHDFFWFYVTLSAVLLVLTIVTLITLRFSRLNQQLSDLLHVKSRFANIGESVNNISHQWKQPLNELAIQLMLLEQLVSDPSLPEAARTRISQTTSKSHDLLAFMAKTVETFGHLMRSHRSHCEFSPRETIEETSDLVRDTFRLHAITVHYTPHDDSRISGNPTEFAHVLLSLLNNVRDLVDERRLDAAAINIASYSRADRFYLTISDNVGGIKTRPIERIFTLGFSDKQSGSSGVGLYIAKQIIEQRFKGTIEVANGEEGAVFTIAIPCTVC